MTNYEVIVRMTPERMEQFLDQVYLTGLNNGMYAARQKNDDILDINPYDDCWLLRQRKQANWGADEEGDAYVLSALVDAISRNAGLSISED